MASVTDSPPLLAPPLQGIAARAGAYDADPRFPRESFDELRAAGVTQLAGHTSFAAEVELVRAVAAADASVARILDGHLNGAERVALAAPSPLREEELRAIAAGELLLGVWGADPAPGEGSPARLRRGAGGALELYGTKTFCSGAGGVQRALVVVRDEQEQRRLAYLDPRVRAEVDTGWYRASGLRASESHRVEFDGTPVLAVLGGADELMRQPWLARDSIRTAATWAGIADSVLDATVEAVAPLALDQLRLHALGQMRLARASLDRWLDHAIAVLGDAEEPPPEPRLAAGECRLAIAQASRTIAAEAVRVCGSRALVGGARLDRARRDLDLFLLQHRLDPVLVELGEQALAQRAMSGARVGAERFERKYERDPDPWGYESRAYERDKYAATLAALPAGRFAVGARGRLLDRRVHAAPRRALRAARRDRLLRARARARARLRLRGVAGVELRRAAFPEDVAPEGWDLVVLSEVLYYLDAAALDAAFAWIEQALGTGASRARGQLARPGPGGAAARRRRPRPARFGVGGPPHARRAHERLSPRPLRWRWDLSAS